MAHVEQIVTKGLGPNFGNEVRAADLGGKSISWTANGPDSVVRYQWSVFPNGDELSASEVQTLQDVIEAHDPNLPYQMPPNDQLLLSIMDETARLKAYPKGARGQQDLDPWLEMLNVLISGGCDGE